MAYGLTVLADLFAVRGHDLKKWLFFRFAEGVRPYKPPFAPRQSSGTASGSGQFVKAADHEKQTLLRLDPLFPTSNQGICHHAKHVPWPDIFLTRWGRLARGISRIRCRWFARRVRRRYRYERDRIATAAIEYRRINFHPRQFDRT